MNIIELANISGDSKLIGYTYSNNYIEVDLYVEEIDKEVRLNAKTVIVEANIYSTANLSIRNCYIEVIELSDILERENDIYVSAKGFPVFMKECKKGLHLAYGKDSRCYGYLLNFMGSERLLTFLVNKIESVQVELR